MTSAGCGGRWGSTSRRGLRRHARGGWKVRADGRIAEPPDAVVLDLGLPDLDGVTSSRACEAGPRPRSSCCRRAAASRTRSSRSTLAPTTTSPSRSAWTSCSPACGRRCAEAGPTEDAPRSRRRDFTRRSRRQDGRRARRVADPAHTDRVACARGPGRNEGKLVGQSQLLQGGLGPGYETESNYLRVYMAQLRRKLEPDPRVRAI